MEENNQELIFKNILDDLLDRFGAGSQEGVKEALRQCQDLYGCVSKSHQSQIGKSFELEAKLVRTIMRFMPSIKESRVEYEIVCCSGRRCQQNGSLEVLQTVKKTLGIDFGERTEDGKLRLSTQNCFKKCGQGPNIMVNGEFHHKMNREKAEKLMKDILKD